MAATKWQILKLKFEKVFKLSILVNIQFEPDK